MKIALLGYGIENQSAYRFLKQKYPQAEFTIFDNNTAPTQPIPEGVQFEGGRQNFFDIDADIVVRTPPISPQRITTRGRVTSTTKLFFNVCPAPIIGVTGSKGKGTTTSLIAGILQAGGKKVHLVGNIGAPALDIIGDIHPNDIVVYELSSFQLWDMRQSPTVAVVLMIEPDHLDVHADMAEYIAAKTNIVAHQTPEDTVVFYAANTYSKAISEASVAQKIPNPSERYAHVDNDFFYYGTQKLCPIDVLKLPGQHNLDNATAAIAAAWQWVQDGSAVGKGLASFEGLPHRLKFVREFEGITYYDDSIATTPGSAIAVLRAFSQPKVVILGGSSKGADFTNLAAELAKAELRQVLLIGQEAPRIAAALDAAGVPYTLLGSPTMPAIVQKARESAQPGDVVVMSPSCASFDMFKNYKDRGDQFINAVMNLK